MPTSRQCTCPAYRFLHREYSGRCEGATGTYCSECRHPCRGEVKDFGIGPYEYWGATGVDKQERLVSECCEASVLKGDGTEYSAGEFRYDAECDRADYENDLRKDEGY